MTNEQLIQLLISCGALLALYALASARYYPSALMRLLLGAGGALYLAVFVELVYQVQPASWQRIPLATLEIVLFVAAPVATAAVVFFPATPESQ